MNFKKGDYVVLLKSCNGENCWNDQIPENYCYKLSEDSHKHDFYVELDCNGSCNNGWYSTNRDYDSKLELRYASMLEIEYYNKTNSPFDVRTILSENCFEEIQEDHDSLIKLLNKIK